MGPRQRSAPALMLERCFLNFLRFTREKENEMNIQPYRKLLIAIAVPIVGLILKALGVDMEFGEDQATSLMNVVIPTLTALGVFAVPNAT